MLPSPFLVIAAALQADPALASPWSLIWQGVQRFALDVAASFAADEASRLLGRDEVAKMRKRLEELQAEVRSHSETAPSAEYDKALKALEGSKVQIDRVAARLMLVELKVDELDERLRKVEKKGAATLQERDVATFEEDTPTAVSLHDRSAPAPTTSIAFSRGSGTIRGSQRQGTSSDRVGDPARPASFPHSGR